MAVAAPIRASGRNLRLALHHAALGRDVFPFALEPKPGGEGFTKTPLVKWKAAATQNPRRIRAMWHAHPDALPGWKLPEGLVVLDIDDASVFAHPLPDDAPSQTTPSGGSHYLFASLDVRQTVKRIAGADTRVGGSGWVGLYMIGSFLGEVPAAPGWMLAETAAAPQAERDFRAMTTRSEIVQWLGSLARAGQLTPEDCLELLSRAYDDGRIYDSEPERPWPPAFSQLAKEAASWSDRDAPNVFRLVRRSHDEDPVEPFSMPLADVERGEAKPLRLGRLDPDDHTILFGDGGTGKGVVAAWWTAQLSAAGEVVLVLDYERHARYEWRPRCEAFRGDLSRIHIAQPNKAIWGESAAIRAEVARLGVTWLVVDSIGYACLGQEVEKSTTATKYSLVIAEIGLPTLSLAHTTKNDADPQHPFGSVFWSNGARVTIGMAGIGEEPRVLTNRKTNQRAPFMPVELDWSWILGDLPRTLHETELKIGVKERAAEALGNDSLEFAELLDRVNADGYSQVSKQSLSNALARSKVLVKSGEEWHRIIRRVQRDAP